MPRWKLAVPTLRSESSAGILFILAFISFTLGLCNTCVTLFVFISGLHFFCHQQCLWRKFRSDAKIIFRCISISSKGWSVRQHNPARHRLTPSKDQRWGPSVFFQPIFGGQLGHFVGRQIWCVLSNGSRVSFITDSALQNLHKCLHRVCISPPHLCRKIFQVPADRIILAPSGLPNCP